MISKYTYEWWVSPPQAILTLYLLNPICEKKNERERSEFKEVKLLFQVTDSVFRMLKDRG